MADDGEAESTPIQRRMLEVIEERKKLGDTRQKLETRADLSKGSLSRIHPYPRPETILGFARAAEVELRWLILGEGPKERVRPEDGAALAEAVARARGANVPERAILSVADPDFLLGEMHRAARLLADHGPTAVSSVQENHTPPPTSGEREVKLKVVKKEPAPEAPLKTVDPPAVRPSKKSEPSRKST